MDLTNLDKILKDEPKYRILQAKKAVFFDLIEDWSEATIFPLFLRQKLNEVCPLSITAKIFPSDDKNTIKAVVSLNDGLKIESVLMKHEDDRNTVCVSSQVGCPLGCKFCATGKMGFKRNLEVFEIVEQVLFFTRYLKKENKRISNIVFMGMGEPFLNYDNLISAIKILNDKDGLNIGARHISISTVGIIEGIKKLSGEKLQLNLAISLHASNSKLRSEIMPVNNSYPIGKILEAVDDYIEKTNRRIMFEYILIDGVNDSKECALELAELLKKHLCFVNLILYNPTGTFRPSSVQTAKKFKEILEKRGISVTQRYRFGQDVGAACGQLAGEQ